MSVVCSFRVCPLAAAVAMPRVRGWGVQPGWRDGRWWKTTASPLWLPHIHYKPKASNNCHFLPIFGLYICVKALDNRRFYTQTPSEEAFSLKKIEFKSLSITWNLIHISRIRLVEFSLFHKSSCVIMWRCSVALLSHHSPRAQVSLASSRVESLELLDGSPASRLFSGLHQIL